MANKYEHTDSGKKILFMFFIGVGFCLYRVCWVFRFALGFIFGVLFARRLRFFYETLATPALVVCGVCCMFQSVFAEHSKFAGPACTFCGVGLVGGRQFFCLEP